MINNNKTWQNLEAISALNVLEDEVAATCSGGEGYTGSDDPDVNFFSGDPFGGGDLLKINADIGDGLSYVGKDFNDKGTLIEVKRGTWEVFRDADYGGGSLGTFGPGLSNLPSEVSSLRRVG